MHLYDKEQVIGYIWQYSMFYGNKLGECERYFEDGEGHDRKNKYRTRI